MGLGGAVQVASMFGRLGLQDDMTPALRKAKGEAEGFGSHLRRALVPGVLAVGAAMGTAAVAAVNSAMEWESAFAGVIKTVDGTPEQLAQIEDGLRELASSGITGSLENAHTQLAAVAEAAGQLGVATDDIVSFTETMAMLGMSTNMTAEEAAFMISQFQNITGMKPEDVDNFGSAIVALGNNMATTEKDIMELAQRLAGAGSMAGMTEANILALSAAMSSVGINAEAGGTAMTMVMNAITEAVAKGGPELSEFARISGWSADQFAQGWRGEPISALDDFITGLGKLSPEEQLAALDALGLSGIRTADTLRRMAGAEGLLSDAIGIANDGFYEGNALQEEAARRAATTASQFNVFKNSLNDLGITIGDALLPMVNDAVQGMTSWIARINQAARAGEGLQALEIAFQGIGNVFGSIVEGGADFVLGVLEDLTGLDLMSASEGWNTFKAVVEALWDRFKNWLVPAVESVIAALSTIWESIRPGVEAFARGIEQFLGPVIELIDRIGGGLQVIKDTVSGQGIVAQGAQALAESDMSFGEKAGVVLNAIGSELFGGRAAGGSVTAGRSYLVGEQGPELFMPGQSGAIIPNGALGGGQIVVQATFYGNGAHDLLDLIERTARDRGYSVGVTG